MRPPVEFVEALQKIAAEHFAASATAGGFDFVDRVYDDYRKSGGTADQSTWLEGNLGRYFKWAESAPRWIEGQPAWPFHQGYPMIFIGQQTVEGRSREELPDGCTFYLFIAWELDPNGRRMVTRLITQHEYMADILRGLDIHPQN